MKKITTTLLIILLGLSTFAQTDVKLNISHLLGTESFAFNKTTKNDLNQDFKLTRFEYYISGISIVHDGGTVTDLPSTYLLVRANNKDSFLLGKIDATTIEGIHFSIGVDPFVNNADPSKWPSTHALSPKSPSMHWGWSAGYRFVALEGKSGASLNQDCQIHALGNANYFKIKIPTSATKVGNALVISLKADYEKALSGIHISDGLIEHSEMDAAAVCLRNFQTKVFTSLTGEGNTVSSKLISIENGFSVAPNPSTSIIQISAKDERLKNATIEVTDLTGKIIFQSTTKQLPIEIDIATKGLYLVRIHSANFVSTSKFLIQ